ncbi:hypothetical protein EDL96_11520 [Kocuria soli]|uniref:Integrase n=1 Tax=Kocuria soli TaxID=2485125 RepID=A0A3N3ZR40_9MICC|nr:tyrosine-type recombinase/integrase [Kocuria soli]ROZ62082.1 hypothetical protein EDL96_11520 [Kocuria soli]
MSTQSDRIPPSWRQAVEQFSTWLTAAGRSQGTVNLRVWWITKLAVDCAPAAPSTITSEEILSWGARHDWSPNTRRSARAALKRFFYWARVTGIRADDPSELLLSVQVPRPTPRPAPMRVLAHALEAAQTDAEQLMLLLASFGGLRRTEIACVHAADIDDDFLLVTGKGGARRFVPIHSALDPFLRRVQDRQGWAFPGRFGGHVHPDYIGKRISRLLGPGWTAHTLRHRFATECYRASRDLLAVQQLLGHASVATTQIYVGVDRDALTAAVAAIPKPPQSAR